MGARRRPEPRPAIAAKARAVASKARTRTAAGPIHVAVEAAEEQKPKQRRERAALVATAQPAALAVTVAKPLTGRSLCVRWLLRCMLRMVRTVRVSTRLTANQCSTSTIEVAVH